MPFSWQTLIIPDGLDSIVFPGNARFFHFGFWRYRPTGECLANLCDVCWQFFGRGGRSSVSALGLRSSTSLLPATHQLLLAGEVRPKTHERTEAGFSDALRLACLFAAPLSPVPICKQGVKWDRELESFFRSTPLGLQAYRCGPICQGFVGQFQSMISGRRFGTE